MNRQLGPANTQQAQMGHLLIGQRERSVMEPLVSIVVPVYNASAHLRRCVDSLTAQSYRRIEVILVNDGSTDDSGALCDVLSAQDNRIAVIHQQNSGVSAARNVGIARSTGEFIQFVDADDFIDPRMTEMLVQEQSRTGGADLVICGFREVDATTGAQRIHRLGVERTMLDRHRLRENLPQLLNSAQLASVCNKLFRSSLITAHGTQFPIDLSYGEDILFVLQFIKNVDNASIIPDTPYSYVRYSNVTNLSRRFRPDAYQIRRRRLEAMTSLLEDPQYDLVRTELERHYALYLVLDIVVYAALNNDWRDRSQHRAYLQTCRDVRQDEYFVRYRADLSSSPRGLRSRHLLSLFEGSRFETIYVALILDQALRSGLSRFSRGVQWLRRK